MYNGIGLTTPRGSGTNGHVQRNWAFVRPGKKENSNYRSEEDIKKLDATLNRPPNKDILDHDRKRKIEVKCLEFEEILEKQGLSTDEIKAKVDSYRQKLMGQGKTDLPKDEFGRIAVRDTHQIAEAQQEKNAKLREAFNISEYFVEGSSFDSDRKAKEDLAKSLALQKELDAQREQAAAASANERESSKRYALVRTPSMERNVSLGDVGGNGDNDDHATKKKKKKIMRESSASPARKKDKKKKSKKRKKESKSKKSKKLRKRKSSESESSAENGKDSPNEDTDSDSEVDVKKSRKKSKKDKKKREKKNKKKERSSSSDKSRSTSPISKLAETKKCETITGKKSSGNPFRSRSKEKSNKSKESQRRHYESSQESRNRRSRSRNNKDFIKCRSRSSGDKDLGNRHTRIENDSRNYGRRDDKRDSCQKHKSSSSDYRSRECNERDYNNRDIDRDRVNRRSRSRQRSRRIDTAERLRDLKRKYSEEHLQRKRDSPSVDKRKKYSCSPSESRSRHSRDNKSYARTTKIVGTPARTRSRTPRHKSSDRQQFQRVNTSRSRSIKENVRNTSLTPTQRITELMETNESKKADTNNFNNQEKDVLNSVSLSQKDAKHTDRKSRSRNTSSSSDSVSSTDTESSRSRTPSPKKELLEKASVVNNIEILKPSSRKTKSPSLKRTPSPANKRSKSSNLLIEKSTEDKQCPVSISRELREKSNEKREEYTKLISKTPPPSRVEKKAFSPRSSRDSSELSYSPARRNPERYRDILENTKNQKTEKRKPGDKDEVRKDLNKSSKQSEERERDRKEKGGKSDKNSAKPVVRLQSQSEDESDATERNAEKMLDEFQESKRERELKDLKMLEQLKTGIAAKAKEKIKTIEKMAACTSTSSSSNTGAEPLVAALADSSLVDAIVSKVSTATVAAAESAARRGRSRSRRSRSRNRREDKTSNGGGSNNGGGGGEREGNRRRSTSHSRSSRSSSSSRSRSRSHSRRSSRSHSSQSSSSSRSSSRSSSSSSFGSSRSGTRSPSIPRRRGSPSFLDRRRITSRYSASRDRRH